MSKNKEPWRKAKFTWDIVGLESLVTPWLFQTGKCAQWMSVCTQKESGAHSWFGWHAYLMLLWYSNMFFRKEMTLHLPVPAYQKSETDEVTPSIPNATQYLTFIKQITEALTHLQTTFTDRLWIIVLSCSNLCIHPAFLHCFVLI